MLYYRKILALICVLLATTRLQAKKQPSVYSIDKLRSLSNTERPAATVQIAEEIRMLPASLVKLQLADALSNVATEDDPSQATLQAVAQTLSQALSEHPLPEKKNKVPLPYLHLAEYVRYWGVTTDLNDPLLSQAEQNLAANDVDIEKADFTLKDLHGKKVTLSQLRGKIVLINFWAPWCPGCRLEMPDLDAIYTHFQSQGLVVLSITNDNSFNVSSFVQGSGYHPTVLLDTDSKTIKEFHITGIPKIYVFDRDGKLVAQSMDQCSQRQMLTMLAKAGLRQ